MWRRVQGPRGSTIALLIRHAHTDAIGSYLAGRSPGVPLSEHGRTQAERLGRELGGWEIAAAYSSPLDRTVETAAALKRYSSIEVRLMHELLEIDFGEWTGKSFDDLDECPEWLEFNRRRSGAAIPGGEAAAESQRRIVEAIENLRRMHAGETFALFSHGDVIRYAVLHYVGASLDFYDRIEISPASVTALRLHPDGPRLVFVNRTFEDGGAT